MKPRLLILLVLAFMLSACSTIAQTTVEERIEPSSISVSTTPTAVPTDTRDASTATSEPTVIEESQPTATLLREDSPPQGAQMEFGTDFSKHSVPYSEILSGGPPKDGIPAIDEPQFISVADADEWLRPEEPVVRIQVEDDARAYPLQIFMWHEIVNDTVGGTPLVVTFCPLCNTAIAFERTFDGQILDFGTTGRLRYSNLIMYDRQTETWWQQATGEAIAGEYTGSMLIFHPAALISWEDFKTTNPQGSVLSRDTGFDRPYGSNPYPGYDDINRSPFLYTGPDTPDELFAMERVLTVDLGDEAVAYPYNELNDVYVVNDTVAGNAIAVFWESGTASSLDAATVSGGRDIGAANAYLRDVDGTALTFEFSDGEIRDLETGSTWNLLGEAVGGQLSGTRLEPVVAVNHFWFSWAAFKPETRIYRSN